MKKLLTILALLMVVCMVNASERTVWTGSQAISWSTDYTGIQVDTYNTEGFTGIFAGLAKDDIIRLYVTPGTNAQYSYKYKAGSEWTWTDLAFISGDGVQSYAVESAEMATYITERGLVISGQDYTLTKITVDDGDNFTPAENETVLSVADGSSALPLTLLSDWSAYTTFAATSFTSAKAGDVITVYVSDVDEGAQISLKDMSDGWPALDESTQYPSVATTDTKYTYTLTETTAAKVKSNGLVIGGQKMTVVRVTLTSTPASTTQYTLTVTQPNGGKIQIGGVDAPESQKYDANTQVTLTPVANSNWQFNKWMSGETELTAESDKTLILTMTEDKSVTAVFTVINAKILDWAHEYTSNSDYDISSAAVGDKIRITFSKTSEEGGDMYLKVSAKSDTWAYDPTFHDGTITETTYDIDVTSENQANITARGLYLQGSNITITNIEVVSAKTTKTLKQANKVMRGEAFNTIVTVAASSFTNASAGDVITINMSSVAESDAVITLKENGGSYAQYTANYAESLTSGQTAYTLEITSDILNRLQGNGLFITGSGFTCDNITITSAGEITEDTSANPTEKWTLKITAPSNGSFTVNDGTSDLTTGASVAYGTTLTLTATPDTDYAFTKWTVNGTDYTDNPQTIIMTEATMVAATFTANPVITPVFDENGKADLSKFVSDAGAEYNYNSTSGEGTITTGDDAWKGISLSIPEDDRVQATKLTIKFKEAAPAYVHITYEGETTWEADDAHQKSGSGTELSLPLDYSKKVSTIHIQLTEANKFAVLTEVSISNKCMLTTSATNGSITVKKDGNVTTDTEFDYGTSLTLTATPASSDYSFKQWVIGETTKTDNPYTFTITGDTEITAEFKSADADVIWLGSQAINWNNGVSQTIAVTEENNLRIADCLVFTITPTVEGIDWPQVQLSSKSDGTPVLIGTSNTAITESTTEVKYYVTKAMLNDITNNGGFIVSGVGFTLTKVKIERGNGGSGYENAIWIGEKVFPSNWSAYQSIGKDIFASATTSQIIRVKYKDVKAGSSINFSYDSDGWKTLPDAAATTADGTATKLIITDDMLTALKAGGLIISGVNFTLTSVDLVDASFIKELTCTVPVTGDDWVWTSSETPTFTVNITNDNNEAVTADAQMIITTDKLAAYKTLTQSKEITANSNGTITFTDKPSAPGFYRATIIVNDETVRAFNFGYAPTEIVSAPDKQSDFDSYWATAKTQLDAVIASDSPTLTEVTDKSTSKRKVYLVELKSIPDGTSGDPVTIRGYYCEPTDGEKHPVLMHYQGYDSFTYGPGGTAPAVYCPSGDDNPDYAEFVISTRGQSLNNREPFNDNPYGQDGWFSANFGDKDSYYYRGAYMDVVRAIEFMATRATSDMDNLFAEGQSQGGAFTYAAAALSGRTFKAIAPAITFMGDFPDYFDIASWPANEARAKQAELGWTDAQLFAFLSYYDTKNLATKVNCPVITSIGVQDNVCPPHTNIAPYNNLSSSVEKKVIFNAELYHATNDLWNDTYMAFFDQYSTWVNPHQPGEISLYDLDDGWSSSYDMSTHTITTTGDWAARGWKVGDGRYNDKGSITVKFQAVDFPVTLKMVYNNTNNEEKAVQAGAPAGETEVELDIPTDVKTINTVHITYEKAGTLVLTEVSVNDKVADNRTEKTLVEKTQSISDGDIEINRGLFSNAVAGDILRIYATGLSSDSKIALESADYSGAFDGANWTSFTESPFTLKLTKSLLSKVQEKNLLIRGENYTFTKAVLYTEQELGEAIGGGGDEPEISNTDASEETKKLFNVLKDLYGKKIVSGVVANVDWNTKEAENVYNWTGKWPALNVYDFINLHASKDVNSEGWLDYSDITTAKNWWKEGGIVGAMWHWQVKANNGTDYTCTPGTAANETSFDASKVYVDGTDENTLAKQQLDQLCGYLKKMQDAGIPVVWRPLHEGSGNVEQYAGGTAWFWWGAKGADVYKQLWQWMYNYMVKTKGLNNLIWVWTSQTKDNNWYPGDAYVDIIGRDNYGATAATLATEYEALKDTYPNKMITLSECGNSETEEMAKLSSIWDAGSRWSWFMTWYDGAYNDGTSTTHKHADKTWWDDAMAKDYVVTRDQMKELLGQDSGGGSQTGVNISLDDLNEGWSSTYDATTKTITTTGEWAARGWYIGDDRYSQKGSITVKYEAVQFGVTLKMEYTNTNGDSKSVSAGAAAGETEVELDIPADVKTIEKVYITYQPIGTLKLTAVSVNEKVADNRTEKTLVEVTQAISDGDIKLNRGLFSNAVAKDVIYIYATGLSDASKIALEPADYSGALDGAQWTAFTESPFTLKLTESALATIKEKGLLVRGENFTFTKATLYTESELGSIIPDEEEPSIDPEVPSTNEPVINEGGEVKLDEVKAQDETTTVTYNKEEETLTITTTEPYKAAQIWLNEPEEVINEVLKVEIAESNANVIVTVGYTDGTETSAASGAATAASRALRALSRGATEETGTVVTVPLSAGKEIQKIEIKNVDPGTITITSMSVTTLINEGETVTLWSSNEGETLAWNDIARQTTDLTNLLKEYDELLITVSARAEGNDWPKVFLRDNNYESVGRETLLNEVTTFPYIVRYVLTSELLEKIKDGFSVCGDGVTITKVELYRPVPPKEGDIHLRSLDYGYGSSYDASITTMTTTTRWAARGWEIGDMRYNSKDLVIIGYEAVDFPVTIKMEYVDDKGQKQATSTGVAAGQNYVQMAIPEGITQLDRVYLTYQNPGSLKLTEASVVTTGEARSRGYINDGVTTGIKDVKRSADMNDKWYDMNGRQVKQPSKGLYIKNGKKIMHH